MEDGKINGKKKVNPLILTGVIILVGGFLIFLYYLNADTNTRKQSPLTAKNESEVTELEEQAKKDPDNDGLQNWEEELRGTNPNNPDTDGDGAKDGKEIEEGRSPLQPAPDDKIEKSTNVQSLVGQSDSQSELSTSTTAKMTRELMSKFLTLKQQKGEVDQATREELVKNVIENTTSDQKKAPTYSLSDLNVSQSISQKEYREKIFSVLEQSSKVKSNEWIVLSKAVRENMDLIRQLQKHAILYRNITQDLAKIEVPNGCKYAHLRLTNSLSKVAYTNKALSESRRDPAKLLISVKLFPKRHQEWLDAWDALEKKCLK